MKLIQLFAEFSLAYHAKLRLKHLCVLIVLLIQRHSHCQHSAKVFSRKARTKALNAKDLSRKVKMEAPRVLTVRLFQPRSREELCIVKLSSPSKVEVK